MSAVWLHVGQCGNQLGLEWWRWVSERPSKDSKSGRESVKHLNTCRYPFCSSDGSLAAVCVDSEPKVLRRTQKLTCTALCGRAWSLRESNIIAGQGGRGSNWAYGYHGAPAEGESSLLSRAMESVRREVERKDCYCGTVLFHSLSGGTGAGLGARLCEEIREQYPAGHILSVSVVPHHHGESPLQHYNSLLSLAALQRSADGVLLFHNDEALSQALTLQGRGLARAHGLPPQASLAAMNSCMASCLAGLLLPVCSLTTTSLSLYSGLSLGLEPWELLRSVCPLPAAKFLHTGQACSSSINVSAGCFLMRDIQKSSTLGWNEIKILSHMEDMQALISLWLYPRDEPSPSLSSRSLTVCSNHSSVEDLLQRVGQRAQDMLRARAYLHWYQRYGCEPHDFLQALDTLSAVTREYSAGGEQGGEADAEWRG
uniref:Tubulin/FtsZ GTPase domain-containing protein n=1 Tax=Lepisosteus oculatus TaxID=7918 RepID=W5MEC1_LEPOC